VPQAKSVFVFLALTTIAVWARDAMSPNRQVHQVPDQDGVYYTGPEVTAPKLVRTVIVPYPDAKTAKEIQGMTVLALVIDTNGIPAHIQVLRTHGNAFDQAVIAVRAVFRANRSQAIPQVLITERDMPPPGESELEDKHHNPLSYTPPFPIHTVDADFADPFTAHPYVQVAIVSVLVSEEGLPKEVRVARGLGFGLDKKAEAAVWHYRFLPATKKGRPIAERREVMVSFAKF
jgi:hypothetical protein